MPFENVLYKYRLAVLHVDLRSPFLSPVPRWRREDRLLRGRELPHVYCCNLRFAFSQEDLVSLLSWDLCLKGSFYWVDQAEAAHEGSSGSVRPPSSHSTGVRLLKESLPESGIRYWESPRPSRTSLFHFKKYF